MCWSGEASTALTLVGAGSTYYFYKKGKHLPLVKTLGYFTVMEGLQAATYPFIDDCQSMANKTMTILSYIHISFQPLCFNYASLYFLPENIQKKVKPWAYGLSLMAAAFLLIRLIPFEWAPKCYEVVYNFIGCPPGKCLFKLPFCGQQTCSVSGAWHVAWQYPASSHPILDNIYFWVGLLLPTIYGSWKFALYTMLTGPTIALLTTKNPNEWAAVWCLYSIGLLILILQTRLVDWMRVRKWIFWAKKDWNVDEKL